VSDAVKVAGVASRESGWWQALVLDESGDEVRDLMSVDFSRRVATRIVRDEEGSPVVDRERGTVLEEEVLAVGWVVRLGDVEIRL
jgi:hypothetical protein